MESNEATYFTVRKEDSLGGGTRTKFRVGTYTKVSMTTYSDIDRGKYGNGIQHGPSFEWYEKGRLMVENAYHNDSPYIQEEYIYDQNGHASQVLVYNTNLPEKLPLLRSAYTYYTLEEI